MFLGGARAIVTVEGDGSTDLDVYVYDENGNLVAKVDGPGDKCRVTWTPRWTGKFTIKVVEGYVSDILVRGDVGDVVDQIKAYLANILESKPANIRGVLSYSSLIARAGSS